MSDQNRELDTCNENRQTENEKTGMDREKMKLFLASGIVLLGWICFFGVIGILLYNMFRPFSPFLNQVIGAILNVILYLPNQFINQTWKGVLVSGFIILAIALKIVWYIHGTRLQAQLENEESEEEEDDGAQNQANAHVPNQVTDTCAQPKIGATCVPAAQDTDSSTIFNDSLLYNRSITPDRMAPDVCSASETVKPRLAVLKKPRLLAWNLSSPVARRTRSRVRAMEQ